MAPFVPSSALIHPPAAGLTSLRMTPTTTVATAVPVSRAPVAVSTVAHAPNVMTANPAALHIQAPWYRPVFIPRSQPRTAFSLPTLISPVATPTDQTLFQEPQAATKLHYLPLYRIAATAGSGGTVKWVSLAPSDNGFVLSVHLADATDPSNASNTRIDASTRYLITATVQSRVVSWDLTAETSTDGAALKLTLKLPDFASRDTLYQAMTDPAAQARLILRRALPIALPVANQPNMFGASTISIDSSIAFTFSRDLDAGVFAQMGTVTTGPAPKWKVVTVNWNGRGYPYYQSTAQPNLIYFLPDSFRIPRRDKRPHTPALSVAMAGDDAATAMLTLAYFAQPVWTAKRIVDAEPTLQQILGLSAPPSLALFQAADTKLFLNLPPPDPSGAPALAEQTGAMIDISTGLQGSVSLNLAQFRQVYDALFDGVSQLLSGEVRITVDSDVQKVPFSARASEFVGDFLQIDNAADTKAGKFVSTLTNVIESPVHFDDLKGTLMRGAAPIAAAITDITPKPPTDLLPCGDDPSKGPSVTVTFTATPAQGLANAGSALLSLFTNKTDADGLTAPPGGVASLIVSDDCVPSFDLSKVSVTIDPKALWGAIMQNQQVGPILRTVTLKAIAAMLKPATAGDTDSTIAIQVVFDNGQTVDFDASQQADTAGFLSQSIKLAVPIDAFVLANADTRTYRYRVDAVTVGGTKTGAWVNDNKDTLFIVSG